MLKKKISKLSKNHLVFFCSLTCEKMLPYYHLFSKAEKWGDGHIFEDIVNKIYSFLLNGADRNYFESLERAISANCPCLDDFENILASYAFDTAIAFDELRLFILTSDTVHVFNNLENCINTVDLFIQINEKIDPRDKLIEEKISQHRLMQKEQLRQITLLDELLNISEINSNSIGYLRKINAEFGNLIDI